MRVGVVGDVEGVLGEVVQDPTGISEELEGHVPNVGDGRSDLQVLHSIYLETRGRGLEGKAGSSRNDSRGGGEDDEGSAEG